MEAAPHLTVVIPAYNEERRLQRAVRQIAEYLRGKKWEFEIIVVNDGSADGTARVTTELAKQFPMVSLINLTPNRGKGAAVRAGMLAARGRFALFTDADLSTPISELDKLLSPVERGDCDIAIGSRAVPGAEVTQPQAWYRSLSGKLFGVATRLFVLRGIADTQCGFKCLKRDVAQKVFPQVTSDSAIFDIEMLLVATQAGFRVAEVPVKWVHDPDTRIPYNLSRALGIFGELFRIRRAHGVCCAVKART